MSEYNQQLCEEKHKGIDARLDTHDTKFANHDLILHGNGKDGIIAKVNRMYEWYQHTTKTHAGWADWAFRICLSLVLTYIAVKVGLK